MSDDGNNCTITWTESNGRLLLDIAFDDGSYAKGIDYLSGPITTASDPIAVANEAGWTLAMDAIEADFHGDHIRAWLVEMA